MFMDDKHIPFYSEIVWHTETMYENILGSFKIQLSVSYSLVLKS
jgi:hypothetical protein